MKRKSKEYENGSVLMMTLLTITILTLICAVSLHVMSQNGNATTQTTSWQQAMAGAEAAVDRAMNALNTSTWSGWSTVTSSSLPSGQPSGGSTATGAPGSGQYNYYTSSFALQGEASNSVQMWVTVDNGSVDPTNGPLTSNTGQAYRIRAGAAVDAPGPARVSNNKLDNDLRKISLRYDRFSTSGSGAVATPQAVRRIELVTVPVVQNTWSPPILLQSWINMSGGGWIDSFDSRFSSKSTNGLYDVTKRQSNANIGSLNSTQSDLHNTYVYGNLQYSTPAGGSAVKNTKNVKGTISSPFKSAIPTVSVPSWPNGQYISYSAGSPPFTDTSGMNKALLKVSGDFTVPGGQTLNIVQGRDSSNNPITNFTIWVTGKLTTSGSGLITQDPSVKVTWIVGKDITVSGSSYQNQSNVAANTTILGYGSKMKATVSGSGNFIGTLTAPNYDVTISGTGAFSGAIAANTLTISGGASFHYDEALAGGNGPGTLGNYAYASWFEDNSLPARGITY